LKQINVVVLGNNRPDLEMMTMYISESLEKHEECKANIIGFIDPDKAYEYIVQNGCDILFSEAVIVRHGRIEPFDKKYAKIIRR